MSKKEESPPVETVFDDEKPPQNQDVMASRSDRQQHNRVDSALWAAINQVPDRLCVTAPPGDRSRSYIHPKTRLHCERRAAAALQTTEQDGACEDGDKAELCAAVREQLSDWQLSSLRSAGDELAALDLTCGGTLNRSDVTHLFLKHDVPLKLPTFSLLLHVFSDKKDPVQIHYRSLLQFIQSSAFPEKLQWS
uniref:uncharacterized protein C1orf87 isoform X2 n=1 Tax=Scatophagus argus TaxID=75038 RepID=UPI001ED8471B|nr:uncharacterized protein C1orf87 isoform X2 [Scatophagus argus]